MSIRVEDLSKVYGNQNAVDNISFEINKGEIVGFLGPNGAGKSTTMKILTCYIPQTSGKAFINGLDTEIESIGIRKKIGYLPEHNPLYLDMYIKEYLAFVAGVFKVKDVKKRIAECIQLTGLELEQKKRIGQLSKGYRQRVGLAQALIHDPDVLILDEPTSGLDPNQVVEIRNLISNLGKEKTVMLSTHQLNEVEAICNRAIIINHGKIVADKPTSELKQFGEDQIILSIEFAAPMSADLLNKIKGIEQVDGDQQKFTLKCSKGESKVQEALFALAVQEGTSIISLQQKDNSLEDVFKSLTQND
jgi:ABC-2 type transport system ATP-binding protein